MTVGELKEMLAYFDDNADIRVIEDEFCGRDGNVISLEPSYLCGGDVQLKVHFSIF